MIRRQLDSEQQAIYGMLLAGIAPEEIAETLGISAVGLEPRLWETVRALGRLDANPRPTQRDRQRPPLVARSAGR